MDGQLAMKARSAIIGASRARTCAGPGDKCKSQEDFFIS
jgi:hypothetical protein